MQEQYELFQKALADKDYMTANHIQNEGGSELQELITKEEKRRVRKGLFEGHETGRYPYSEGLS